MSDSESSQEVQVKVTQEQQAHMKDLLHKAKLITPFYDDETLTNIFKECFYTESVFFNKLNIIAKTRITTENEQQNGWISTKQHQKSNNRQPRSTEGNISRPRYNFLQDKQLLARAKDFNPEKERQLRSKRHKARQDKIKNHYQNKDLENQNSQPEKKLKYKQAIDNNEKDHRFNGNNKPAIESKPQKYIEKKQTPENLPQKKAQTKTNTQTNQKQKQSSNQKPALAVPAASLTNNEQVNVKPTAPIQSETPKKQQKLKYKPKEEVPETKNGDVRPTKTDEVKSTKTEETKTTKIQEIKATKVEEPKPVKYEEKKIVKAPQVQNTKAAEPTPEIKKQTSQPEEPTQYSFESSCQQNSFVLKFIKPTQRLQKISYIRYPDGKMTEVKVREVLNKH